jgi:plastocyanin
MKRTLFVLALVIMLMVAACSEVPIETPKPIVESSAAPVVESTAAFESDPTPTEVSPKPLASPRNLGVLVGAGRDTISISAFFPKNVRLRVGDTITWNNNTDDTHNVMFVSGEEFPEFNVRVAASSANLVIGAPAALTPQVIVNPIVANSTREANSPIEIYSGDGYFNSGIFTRPFGPDNANIETYSLKFDTPGVYEYLCLIHPFMTGTVEVMSVDSSGLPSKDELDIQAEKEISAMMAKVEGVIRSSRILRKEQGPDESTMWHVQVGARRGTFEVQLLQFAPKDLTVQEGDTVVFTSAVFHNVTFHPGQPPPAFEVLDYTSQGSARLIVNPKVAFPSKSSGEFDGTGFFTSGLIGPGYLPGGTTFTMNFAKPGVYHYICAIHREMGMVGTVTVVPVS